MIKMLLTLVGKLKDRRAGFDLITQFYFVWLMMNVIIGLMPIFSDFLDGKSVMEVFPSLLLVYVVILASSSHMFIKQKDVPINKKLIKFSLSMVWIMSLLIISSKYTAHQAEWEKYTFVGIDLITALAILFSAISILLAAFNSYPDIEFDKKAVEEQRKLAGAERSVKEQNLDDFSNVEKM